MNMQKQRATIEAYANLKKVTIDRGRGPRKAIHRVTQPSLAAIVAGREAVKRLQDLTKDMQKLVASAEGLVVEAITFGRPVTSGLLTPTVVTKTKVARVSWKTAANDLAIRAGLDFDVVEADLRDVAAERNEDYVVLDLR